MSRSGRSLSTGSNKVEASSKAEEAETVDVKPPSTEKVICHVLEELPWS